MYAKVSRGLQAACVLSILLLLVTPQRADGQGCTVTPADECICNGSPKCCGADRCDCNWDNNSCSCICSAGPHDKMSSCAPGAYMALGVNSLFYPDRSLVKGPALLASSTGTLATGTQQSSRGAYVDWIVKGSPADRAGLRQGDVIVQVGTSAIGSAGELNSTLAQASTGPVELSFMRDGATHSIEINAVDPISFLPKIRSPFGAKLVEERDWTENGVSFHQLKTTEVYRDALGREATVTLTPHMDGSLLRSGHIFDPVKGVNIVFDERSRTADIIDSVWRPGYVRKHKPQILRWIEYPSQYLGTKTIQGLTCEGHRMKRVLEDPSDLGIVSPGPLAFTSEIWLSDLTLVPVLQIDENPLVGRVTTRMVEVHENLDPEASVFEVPAGYSVRERPFSDIWEKAETQNPDHGLASLVRGE